MNNVEISIVEIAESAYKAHLLNTNTQNEFDFSFDFAKKQELQDMMNRISRGETDVDFSAQLKKYGHDLYNLLFNGEFGTEFRKLCKEGFCLHLNLPPALEILPWEYLADKEDFLFKGRNCLIRVPSEKKDLSLHKIAPPVRLLVVISNPPDLHENMKLDVVREKRLIKDALRPLIDEGKLAVKWEDEASLERIQDALINFKPHVIHYTGHGGFDEKNGGTLLLEDGKDHSMPTGGAVLAERLAGRDVRLIVLSGCQTAVTKTTDPFSSVAGALVKKGIASVIAMQQSILDDSAIVFASRFYMALANGEPVDAALGEARLSMNTPRTTRENTKQYSLLDWGIPVLISSARDLNLFNLDGSAPKPAPPAPKGFSKINLPNPGDIFVGRQKEQRQIAHVLRGGDARCIMILGPGGIGKSSLAARAIEQSEEYFNAVLTIGCKTAPSAEQVLLEINMFLNLNGITHFSQVMQAQLDLSQKIDYLPQILNTSRILLIFDNFEDMLDITREPHAIKDANIRHLLETLTLNLRGSRVMITSRQDFVFTREGRHQAHIFPVPLRELTKMEAFRLMQNIPSLCNAADEEKLEIFTKVGGNPFILDLVAARAKDVPVKNVLAEINDVQKEFVEKTMLNNLYEWLPDDETKTFFRKASIFRMPVNQDFLVAVGGSDERIGYLLHKSMLNRISEDMYEMHSNTRAFGSEKLKEIDGSTGLKDTQITAAKTYINMGKERKNFEDYLEARRFYFGAGEFDKAGEIVIFLSEPLIMWGYIELIKDLNIETAESATGELKANALLLLGNINKDQGNYDEAAKKYQDGMEVFECLKNKGGIAHTLQGLANIHHDQGRYDEAVKIYQKSQKLYEELGDKRGIAETLHQFGNIHYLQGKYEDAVKLYQESLKIKYELGDKGGIAATLHQLGMIYQKQGRYDEAVKLYQESLKIKYEFGDKRGIAYTLGQIGNNHYLQGRYDEALTFYQETLKISDEMGDKRGIATTLHQLGNIHYLQGRYDEAVKLYERSMKISKKLGDKSGIATTLHQLGIIHQDQGRYDHAIKLFQGSMKIKEELGDKGGIATTLHQLGIIHQDQGRYDEAAKLYEKSMKIFEELGDKSGIANTVGQMGIIHQVQGRYDEAAKLYEKSMKISEELGDKSGIAATLHQLGNIHYLQGRYDSAVKLYEKSMKISEELGDISGIARTLHQLGMIYHNQGRYDEAVKFYQESMKVFQELGNRAEITRTLHQLGNIHYLQGRYDSAVKLYQESLKVLEELGDKAGIATTQGQLGKVFYAQQKYREALKCYLFAFITFNKLKSPYKDLVGKNIVALRKELGKELFDQYYQEITSEALQ